MPIDFDPQRWDKIRRDYRAWWAGDLERPLIHLTGTGKDPGRDEPELRSVGCAQLYDPAVAAEDIVDLWDYGLSQQTYLGDAFPSVSPNLGPGVLAACLGGVAEPRDDTVWFHPARDLPIERISLAYDGDSPTARRIKDIVRAAVDRWGDAVQVGMTDLGGNLDILSTFRPGEQLLLDLYDKPDEVKRVTWEAHKAWFEAFEDFTNVTSPANPGYSAWTSIFSEEPYYMLQCDFCYMISPVMFDEFVRPELAATCERLGNPFYHLDGPGELGHLDSLLEIERLKGVQWIPGAGAPPQSEWPDVYRKIHAAGKLIQLFGWGGQEGQTLDAIADQIGTAKGIILIDSVSAEDEDQMVRLLERYGAA